MQDIEDEIMINKSIPNNIKQDFMNIIKKETETPTEFLDKMRVVMIFLLCSSDPTEIKNVIELMKTLHPSEFNENMVQKILKKRKVTYKLVIIYRTLRVSLERISRLLRTLERRTSSVAWLSR